MSHSEILSESKAVEILTTALKDTRAELDLYKEFYRATVNMDHFPVSVKARRVREARKAIENLD